MEQPLTVQVPEGPGLEARLWEPTLAAAGLVLCHPHPLYGGDMDNPVVVRAAEVAQQLGLATLRFNFRGVGASGGAHGGGIAERDDVRAALARLRSVVPPAGPIGLLGYSFGAWVSARVAAEPGAGLPLCLIGPPLRMLDWSTVPPARPDLLVVAGTRDSYCAPPDLERFTARLPGARAVVIDGADHFFFGKLYPMGEAVASWCRAWAGASASLPGEPGRRGGAG
jgi:alpha/beta superfamily hydrolase